MTLSIRLRPRPGARQRCAICLAHVALGLKGIPYRFQAIDPQERAEVVRLSKQPLTPVLQHGDVVLSDSAAILRYLDANFDGPRL